MDKFINSVNNLSFKKTLFVLAVIFSLSVIIRIPNLNRPLSYHHEWLTAVTLRVAEIFDRSGMKTYHFSPVMTYPEASGKNIDNTSVSFSPKDQRGDYYYVSYPPLFYIFFYSSLKLFGAGFTILNAQIFNLILHLACAFLIFLIVSLIFNKKNNLAAILGFSLYVFLPLNLWFHSNVIMTEIFVQLFFIAGIYVFLKLESSPRPIYFWLLGVVTFLFCYTEWLGIFFATAVSLYALSRIKKDQNSFIVFLIAALSSLAALLLVIGQYAQISGLGAYLHSAVQKFQFRSGFSAIAPQNTLIYNPASFEILSTNYFLSFGSFLLIALSLLFLFLRDRNRPSDRALKLALYLSIAPVALHHLVFFNGAVEHDFFLLKDSVPLCLFIALCLPKYLKNQGVALFVAASFLVSIFLYSEINENYSLAPKIIGEEIKYYSAPQEMAFLNKSFIEPQIIFYAQRNVAPFESIEKAKESLKENKVDQGIIFILNEGGNNVKRIIRIKNSSPAPETSF